MSDEILATSDDGSIEYKRFKPKYADGTIALLRDSFAMHENCCKINHFSEDPLAVEELVSLGIFAIHDNLSVVAIDKVTDKVAGVAINKLNLKTDPLDDNFIDNFQRPGMRNVAKILVKMENKCNLFEKYQTDCIFEIFMISTSPGFRGKGIAKTLCKISIDLAKKLQRPQAVSSVFTSFMTQKIGRSLDFDLVASEDFLSFAEGHDSQELARIIGDQTKFATLECKRI